MHPLSSVLWVIPLSVHVGYVLATYSHLPDTIGRGNEGLGTSTNMFLLGWLSITLLFNLAFFLIQVKLPKLKDKYLSVPNRSYWLSTPEERRRLIDYLSFITQAALLGLNVFFLSVYQVIYQTNTEKPVLTFPLMVLFAGFMGAPIVLVIIVMIFVVFRLSAPNR